MLDFLEKDLGLEKDEVSPESPKIIEIKGEALNQYGFNYDNDEWKE